MAAAEQVATHERSALDELAGVCRRLADLVSAVSRRSDVRDRRAKILLLVAARRCPTKARRLRRPWYVRGAAARFGAERIAAEWVDRFREPAPSLRTIRKHLADLEANCAIARGPGDWMPTVRDRAHPEQRPRYPDTITLLETDREAEWWATVGAELRKRHPDTRHNPDRWRMVFGTWRQQLAVDEEIELGPLFAWAARQEPTSDSPTEAAQPRAADAAATISAAVRAGGDTFALQAALAAAGARLAGPNSFRAGGDRERLAGAAALLALALAREDGSPRRRIRSRAGWLWRAFRYASDAEMNHARRCVAAARPLDPHRGGTACE
ncbi:MAG: hypothetical protein AAF682_19510 [Planctomycetota bacterium]